MPSQVFAQSLLDGQVAVVTGGGSGLGRATAIELAACGAHVIVAGGDQGPLDETAALCDGGRCAGFVCDLREEDEVEAFVEGVVESHGRIDTVVNYSLEDDPAEDLTPRDFDTAQRLNVRGTWLMTHSVATRAMIPARAGKVVNLTPSLHHGRPGMAHSSSARAALENLTRVLSIEWARYGIRVNAIAAEHLGADVEGSPRPEEHAWLVAYLASRAGEYCSGAVFTADGLAAPLRPN
jgi:citronellol/citronellal dehydrogenase